jgi:uncharacterized protein
MPFSIPSPLPFYLLCSALLLVRLPYFSPLAVLVVVTPIVAVTSVMTGAMDAMGVLMIALFVLLTWITSKDMALRFAKVASIVVTALFGLAIALNVVPGFHSANHANMGKGLVGFVLVCFLCPRITSWSELKAGARLWWLPSLLTVVLVYSIALAFGYIRFNPTLKPNLGSLLLYNLFFVCFAEEAFFRVLLQSGLARALSRWRSAEWITLIGVSVLFGLIHFTSKVPLQVAPVGLSLAAIAGFGYGYVLMKTKRLEFAVALHFVVNAILFIGFDSPLQK